MLPMVVIVYIVVEVVDAPLDYTMLLGRNCMHGMRVVVSYVFHTIHFPHEVKVVIIDQLMYSLT
jgi:hypothetical protein